MKKKIKMDCKNERKRRIKILMRILFDDFYDRFLTFYKFLYCRSLTGTVGFGTLRNC